MENPNYDPKQQGVPPPYAPPQQPSYQAQYPPNQGYPPQQPPPPTTTHVTVTQPPSTQVVVVGNCPVCHVGTMHEQYSVCGIILAVLFFPIGILCCLAMTERVCTHCGAHCG